MKVQVQAALRKDLQAFKGAITVIVKDLTARLRPLTSSPVSRERREAQTWGARLADR